MSLICNETRRHSYLYVGENGNEKKSRKQLPGTVLELRVLYHILICCFYVHVHFQCQRFSSLILLFHFIVQINENNHLFVCLFVSHRFPFFSIYIPTVHGNFCVYPSMPYTTFKRSRRKRNWISWQEKKMSSVCVRARPIQRRHNENKRFCSYHFFWNCHCKTFRNELSKLKGMYIVHRCALYTKTKLMLENVSNSIFSLVFISFFFIFTIWWKTIVLDLFRI